MNRDWIFSRRALLGNISLGALAVAAGPALARPRAVERRIDALIARMTSEDKASQGGPA